MYIYRGKLDFEPSHLQTATYEGITTIFPSQFCLGDPVYICWQWTMLGKITNVPCWLTGIIDSAANSDSDGNKIGFYGGDYRFDTTISQTSSFLANNGYYRFDGFLSGSKGIEKLLLVVRSGNVVGTATDAKLVFSSGPTINPGVIIPRVYLGRLANWGSYSTEQPLLVIIPDRTVAEGNAICAFWQWAVEHDGTKKRNINFTPSKMTNVENVADYVSFQFTNGYYTFHATVSSKEAAEQQQLTLVMKNPANDSTGSLTLELQDLRPLPSGRQPRGINNSTAVVINDTNKIAGGSQNDGPSLMRPLVEMGLKLLELTNKLNEKLNDLEQAVRDRDAIIAQLQSQLRVAQLESQLRASQDENKLLNTKLLETESAREKD